MVGAKILKTIVVQQFLLLRECVQPVPVEKSLPDTAVSDNLDSAGINTV